MFFAAYNTETKVLKYSSGGLNCYPILRKNNGEIYELSDNNGFPISKLGDLYTPEYTSSTIKLNDQDLVFFYTDGLIDYQKNQVIDYDELINLIKENGNARVIDQILEEKINNNKNHLNDDITYFIMEV
jgi:sigma-B regulation protein RsbU (phosphoserine phosphatase)